MIACREAETLLPLFVGGDLDGAAEAEVRSHLAGCGPCREVVADFRATTAWIRRPGLPEIGDAAYERLRRAVRQRVAGERPRPLLLALLGRAFVGRRGGMLQPGAALAAVALAALGSVGLHTPRAPEAPPVATITPAAAATALARKTERTEGDAQTAAGGGAEMLLARGESDPSDTAESDVEAEPADRLRIELQTSDPDVRIIWFSAHADSSVVR